MSKKKRIENLAVFIGLRAAHEILIEMTNKPESAAHLGNEADNYSNLSIELAKGNWNKEDIENIKIISAKKCRIKLSKYKDISDEKYNKIERAIENAMLDLELTYTRGI